MKNSLYALKRGKAISSKQKKRQYKKRKKRKNKNITINKTRIKLRKPLFVFPDKKMRLLLKRTLFLKEISIIERYINSEKFLCEKINLSKEEFNRLIMEYNYLLNLQKLNFKIGTQRELLNRTFAALAFGAGLDAAIIDAKDLELIRVIKMLEANKPENYTDELCIKLANTIRNFEEIESIMYNAKNLDEKLIIKTAKIMLNYEIYSDSFTQI